MGAESEGVIRHLAYRKKAVRSTDVERVQQYYFLAFLFGFSSFLFVGCFFAAFFNFFHFAGIFLKPLLKVFSYLGNCG